MDRLEKLLSQMSVHDKIGQLTQYNAMLFTETSAEITGPQQKLGLTDEDLAAVGSVLNFSSVQEVKDIQTAHLQNDPNQIPIVFMMDVIHGYRTVYPIPLALGCSFDPQIAEECSRVAAREASADGVHVTFTPMVDYVRDARWGRVMETCGEEPRLTSALAAAQIRGFHGDGMEKPGNLATCVKHYAGYGGAEAGRDYNLVEVSERELREYYLPAYKACLDAGAPMVMPSFNSLNGVPSIANSMLMQDILRKEWGFDGVVISDYNAIGELLPHGVAADQKEAAKLAFENTCDIEMCSSGYFHHLESLINEGVFTMEQLDAAVMRVLKFKDQLGLFDDPYHGADEKLASSLFLCDAHREVVKKAAAESAVLLKNEGLLPLSEKLSKVAVIGPFADEHGINGFWSAHGKNEETTTVFEGIRNILGADKVVTAKGCGNLWDDKDCSGFAEAVEMAKAADAVVLCLGEPQNYSGEGNCRTDLRLPGLQEALAKQVIAANPNTAVVLFNGRPLDVSLLDKIAPAILTMWFPGTEGGSAAAELLFGKCNPCGKLSMSFPHNVGQCPIYYNHPNTGRPRWRSQPDHRGYASDYIDCATLPLYSFGHGLSYSNFVYSDLTLSSKTLTSDGSIRVSVKVRNDSSVPGKEVVQLYMRDLVGSVVRPVQQLIAFEKLSFEAGEEKTVTFTVTEEMLRFWNMKGEHISEKGDFTLMIGHADHFVLSDAFQLV
ncbi:MAG: beta-glucosidase BglX [Ruminococcaceae bacterium]|nr:beta-glucosidase BglX [Oscillospiraceae bacterium]